MGTVRMPSHFWFFSSNNHSENQSNMPCKNGRMRNSIWLLETKFSYPTSRGLCAVESLATQMPNWCIRFYILNFNGTEPIDGSALRNVTKLKRNVEISRLYPEHVLSGTPLQNFSSGDPRKSQHFITQIADSLRCALLYKYGGIYVDLDMIAKRPLETAENYFTRQVPGGMIGSCIIKAANPMEPVFWSAMQIARKDFRPNTYASLLTSFNSAVVAYCESMRVRVRQVHNQENLIEKCGDWYVLGANAGGMCHPYQMYEDDPDKVKEQMAQLEIENCTLYHWYSSYNKHTHRPLNLTSDKEVFFAEIARQYCPIVYNSVQVL